MGSTDNLIYECVSVKISTRVALVRYAMNVSNG